ncbi:MAG: hypothetical protein NUV77_15625 [Thermoguttaceae bacterium]|jgi:hypothetical protein|nr:hypothetical protein [Thermoguttaceae bacterium]
MNPFRVWIRPLGTTCRVRVEGLKNARWLLDRLGQSFVFKTSEALDEGHDSPCCTFQISYSSQTPRSAFEKLLVAIPEVKLMSEPA